MKSKRRSCIVLGVVCLSSLLLLARSTPEAATQPRPALKVNALFSKHIPGPAFMVEYTNTGKTPIDLIRLLAEETILLDRDEHKRRLILFTGNPSLGPGQSCKHPVHLRNFLPDSTTVHRGSHKIVFKFAGLKSETIQFDCDEDYHLSLSPSPESLKANK